MSYEIRMGESVCDEGYRGIVLFSGQKKFS